MPTGLNAKENIMKCTHCGNSNLIKTYFPLKSYGDGGAELSKEVEVYFCLECGHYELFSQAKIENYKNTLEWIRNTELKIEGLHKELEELQDPLTVQNIQNEINMCENQLKNLDITIREQQNLKDRVSTLKRQLQIIPSRITRTKDEVERLQRELNTKKYNFERGSF